MAVRLPIPPSETTSRVASSLRTTTIPTTWSSSPSLMPRTPSDTRPWLRASRSLNRMALPFCVARITSLSPSVIWTSMSSSPSRMLMPMRPTNRTLPYAERAVFLTLPSLVQKSR